jgi:hypothetical protein
MLMTVGIGLGVVRVVFVRVSWLLLLVAVVWIFCSKEEGEKIGGWVYMVRTYPCALSCFGLRLRAS